MNDLFDEVNSITRLGNCKIISTSSNKYFLKENVNVLSTDIFDYLSTRNFLSFIPVIKSNSKYNVFNYISDKRDNDLDKAIDLVLLFSMLHNKTTNYRDVMLDEVKKLYEEQLELINYLRMYYEDLQDYIERKVYMAPGEYLLIRHISEIYLALDYSYNMLEEWYLEKSNKKTERFVFLHNNLSVDHLVQGDENYLVSWDKASRGIVVYDFINFYKNDYLKLEMNSLYNTYQSRYKFDTCEEKLFFSLLVIPWKVEFTSSNLDNTINSLNLVRYIIKTREFILNQNKKYQKTNKEEIK